MRELIAKAARAVSPVVPDRLMVEARYYRLLGRLPDLKNPRRFTEKIAWRKLYQRDPRFVVYADKVAVKSEISNLIGNQHVIPTYWAGTTSADIPYDELSYPCVVKANHHSGEHVFLKSRQDVEKARVDAVIGRLLNQTHGKQTNEWAYTQIPRRVMVEKMLLKPDGQVPEDYKFFVFHGRTELIQVDFGRFQNQVRGFYNREMQLLPLQVDHACSDSVPRPNSGCTLPAPNLQELLRIAERIGAQFDFARIDLYLCGDEIYFGEATFYPMNGHQRYTPDDWDFRLGEFWRMNGSRRQAFVAAS